MALGGPWREFAKVKAFQFSFLYGRTFEAEREYLIEQREWLNSIRAQLEKAWEPLGITESIKIYW
jgi:hypothetical protein